MLNIANKYSYVEVVHSSRVSILMLPSNIVDIVGLKCVSIPAFP